MTISWLPYKAIIPDGDCNNKHNSAKTAIYYQTVYVMHSVGVAWTHTSLSMSTILFSEKKVYIYSKLRADNHYGEGVSKCP